MNAKILENLENTVFEGCDFVLQFPEGQKGRDIRVLQLTDMQIIDSTQRRTPDRLRADQIDAWLPEKFDAMCGNHMRSLVAQTRPDLILITGDIVYGSFDDSGNTLRYLCRLLDSFEIPWAPVFGNHDNESAMGVAWQCEQFAKSAYCLFKRGTVSGNSNYTVGVAVGDALVRVIHMLDSNGCCGGTDPAIIKEKGIYPDQLAWIDKNTALIRSAQKKAVPAFAALHIPPDCFYDAELAKGYRKNEDDLYVLGVDVLPKDGDFGFSLEKYTQHVFHTEDLIGFFKAHGVDGVFAGHIHNNCFSISHRGIVWTFGLKTGQYDYHVPYQIGGTLITLNGSSFHVSHVPSLVLCGAMPAKAPMFKNFLTYGES